MSKKRKVNRDDSNIQAENDLIAIQLRHEKEDNQLFKLPSNLTKKTDIINEFPKNPKKRRLSDLSLKTI